MIQVDSQSLGITDGSPHLNAPEADGGKDPPSLSVTNAIKKTKKRSSFSLFKTALILMRWPHDDQKKKSAQPDDEPASKGNWKKLVGSMRPLHLQDKSPPTSLPALSPSPTVENLEDLVSGDFSPCSPLSSISGATISQYASTNNLQQLDVSAWETHQDRINVDFTFSPLSSISGSIMSQYASASNLQELDVPDDSNEEKKPDDTLDAIHEDEMIDSKADEFIAQFYHRMKLQHLNSI